MTVGETTAVIESKTNDEFLHELRLTLAASTNAYIRPHCDKNDNVECYKLVNEVNFDR